MKLNKLLVAILSIAMTVTFVGCGNSGKKAEKTELTILAAASLTDVCDEIKKTYEKKHDVVLNFSYGSSGALQTQIEEGIKADMFMSASLDQMNTLASKKFIEKDSVKNLLENKIVLITSKVQNKVKSLKDLTKSDVKLIGIGNPESVPAGKYAKQVFDSLKIWDKVEKKVNMGTDVRTVLAWVESGEVDCGLVYETDAKSSDKVFIKDTARKGLCDDIIYPIGALKKSDNKDKVKELMDFMSSKEGMTIFKKYGFYESK